MDGPVFIEVIDARETEVSQKGEEKKNKKQGFLGVFGKSIRFRWWRHLFSVSRTMTYLLVREGR